MMLSDNKEYENTEIVRGANFMVTRVFERFKYKLVAN